MFDLRTCLCDIGQILLCTVERKQVPIVNNVGTEKKNVPIHRRGLIQQRPPSHTQVSSNAIYFLLAFVSTRAGLSPDLTKARH